MDLLIVNILIDDLKYKSNFGDKWGQYWDGYRIVYFYPDNTYEVGIFSGSIEGFMMDFAEVEPIWDESNIPNFVSIDDLLNRYLLDFADVSAVAIYKKTIHRNLWSVYSFVNSLFLLVLLDHLLY